MTADSDLVAAVTARVVQTEMARRIPGWDGPVPAVPPDLPPLTLLAGRAFPLAVLQRRLRFLRLMGWYPELPAGAAPGAAAVGPPRPPVLSIEDRLAAIYGAPADWVSVSEGAQGAVGPEGAHGAAGGEKAADADPDLGALARALRGPGAGISGSADVAARATLTAFFDRQADAAAPGWRERWPRRPEAASAWARVEATALHGDRPFGPRGRGPARRALSTAVWHLAEFNRRHWE